VNFITKCRILRESVIALACGPALAKPDERCGPYLGRGCSRRQKVKRLLVIGILI